MRDVLAERLLAEVMKWTAEDVSRERPDLQALATFKYDEYQQFSPGMRFVESLALWLNQFRTSEERQIAYKFVRSRLVFISLAEMGHLVAVAFPDYIRPFIIRQTANHIGISEMFVSRLAMSTEFQLLLRQSLFLGLSDGAHIDIFRRNNPEISHEQVWQSYEIPDNKADDMFDKLSEDLERILGRVPNDEEKRFKTIFLLDDFSGSGLSYLRRESNCDNLQYKGKIHKVLSSFNDADNELRKLVNPRDLHICIILYVATLRGLEHLNNHIRSWLEENRSSIKCTIVAIHKIPDVTLLSIDKDKDFIVLLEKYFDKSIIDEHYSKGKHDKPYLGFDECALPLILSHNSPNNSLPLLWFEDHRKYRGLFPRVSRHRRNL